MRSTAGICLLLAAVAVRGVAAEDPVRNDPSPKLRPAASMEEIAIPSAGSRMNGLVYLAAGPGPHPVVVILHGFPGNERNLDLAQAVRRAGYDAVFFDYRGSWGSGGTFSMSNALADVSAAFAWVRDPQIAAKYGFDGARVALLGHSFGGWLALMKAPELPPGVCIAALAAWNVGWAAQHDAERDSTFGDFHNATDPAGGPIHANEADLRAEFLDHAKPWNYLTQATALKQHALLLVAPSRDSRDEDIAMHRDLERAIRAAGGTRVRLVTFDDDHPFSSHRVQLGEVVVRWLQKGCR